MTCHCVGVEMEPSNSSKPSMTTVPD
jgi:hypothetical protein